MKRGLVVLDPAEVPDEEWSSRVSRLQQRMAEEGLSVALIYGDVFRSDDIGYLTNLCIYWNEGILAVPAEGPPVFLTKLSPRVHPWMRATSKVTDLRSGKSFGQLVQTLSQEHEPGVLGLVDGPLWPAPVVEEITEALSGWEVRLLGGVVREERLVPSDAELALLRHGAGRLRSATADAIRPGTPPGEWMAIVERELRGAGFTDLTANVATTTEGVVTLEVSAEYRHGWLHISRLMDAEGAGTPWVAGLTAALQAAVEVVAEGALVSDLVTAAGGQLQGLPADARWHVACVNQADMATNGEFQGASSGEPVPRGAVVVVSVEVLFADGGRAAVAGTVRVGRDGAELLASPDVEPMSAAEKGEAP